MTGLAAEAREPSTTSGEIALMNLRAQIANLAVRVHRAGSGPGAETLTGTAAKAGVLVDLLMLRGRVLGCIADYERAAGLAERLVHDSPGDPTALLARAGSNGTLHRFSEALTDLDAAARNGADPAGLDAERAAILQAVGCRTEALALRRAAAERRRDITTLGALAVLQAQRGEVADAERLFAEARRGYRGVSPFPVAELEFRRGLMWLGEGDPYRARASFDAAQRRVPAYAPAQRRLAEVEADLGDHDAAIERLRPLAASSDDPEYAASLAGVLRLSGHHAEADRWCARAAARYDELVQRHPEAFAHHAKDFWTTVGGDRPKGLELARQDRAMRQKARVDALRHLAVLENKTC